MPRIVEKGASDLIVATMDSEGSFGTTSKKIAGLLEMVLDLSEATKDIPADDDPAFMTKRGFVKGTGTLRITGIPIADYAILTSATVGTSGVIAFGEDAPAKYSGISFKKKVEEDGVESTNMLMIHKAIFGIPKEGSRTLEEDGTNVTECEIPFEVKPAFYTAADGTTKKRRTLTKLNSATHATLWTTLKDKCFTPDEAPLDAQS